MKTHKQVTWAIIIFILKKYVYAKWLRTELTESICLLDKNICSASQWKHLICGKKHLSSNFHTKNILTELGNIQIPAYFEWKKLLDSKLIRNKIWKKWIRPFVAIMLKNIIPCVQYVASIYFQAKFDLDDYDTIIKCFFSFSKFHLHPFLNCIRISCNFISFQV